MLWIIKRIKRNVSSKIRVNLIDCENVLANVLPGNVSISEKKAYICSILTVGSSLLLDEILTELSRQDQ